MPPVYLLCEGKPDSADARLLNEILAQHHKLSIRIVPIEGGGKIASVRSWHEDRERDLGAVAISVKDRDYVPLADVQAEWANPAGKAYRWTHHEIENFLLAPWLLREQFEEWRRTVTDSCVATLPPDAAAIEAILAAEATRLFTDHIAHVLHHELRSHKATLGRMELNEPKVDPLAGTQSQWLAGLEAEIAKLRSTCAAIAAEPAFGSAALAVAWNGIEAQVLAPAFLSSGDYLREMKGKRLFNRLFEHLRATTRFRLEEAELKTELVGTARRVYLSSPAHVFPDLERLAARLRTATGQ